jgi:hypothetical protein
VQGYDGFGGVHDNLIWAPKECFSVYTLNNKLIIEDSNDRSQFVAIESTQRLSCIAKSESLIEGDLNRMVAVGQGDVGKDGIAQIFIYDIIETRNQRES